jgi:hypothetical protein
VGLLWRIGEGATHPESCTADTSGEVRSRTVSSGYGESCRVVQSRRNLDKVVLGWVARDSGTSRGRRTIRGGRAHVRQASYRPALVAARFNPGLKAKYQAPLRAGKSAKSALTAIMPKLIILANALLRDRRHWTPKPA